MSMTLARCFRIVPTMLVVPTINNEYDEATTTSRENRYTRIGTDKIDPPPPIIPNKRPTPISEAYPKISMIIFCCSTVVLNLFDSFEEDADVYQLKSRNQE